MKSLKKILKERKKVRQIKSLVSSLEEISSLQIKSIKDEIMLARDFLESLARVSFDVGSDLNSFEQTKKTISVYLSSDDSMYGDLPEKVFVDFINHVENNKTDILVVGSQGARFMKIYRPRTNFEFADIKTGTVNPDHLPQILEKVVGYHEVVVFYGKFRNIVNQDSVHESIISDYLQVFNQMADESQRKERQLKYIYEPSPLAVSEKFANEIKTSVFDGMIKEHELAKTASRVMHLEKVYDKIDKDLNKINWSINKAKKRLEDKRQNERVIRIWAR